MKTTFIAAVFASTLFPLCSLASTPLADSLIQDVLSTHNKFRAKHDAPPLQWDSSLAEYAQRHANQCIFEHTHGPYGENLAAGYRTPEAGMIAWYSEESLYSYTNPHFSKDTGHFTQMVWKSTRKVGCALSPCNGQHGTPGSYLVCEYSPAGNIINPGYFSMNVTPPLKPTPLQASNLGKSDIK